MSKRNAGFTLVETVVVMAIMGLLFSIAFAGYHELIARARFDTSIDKTIENISFARNYAMSNVNSAGPGNTKDVIGGVSLEWDTVHHPVDGYPLMEIQQLYEATDANGDPILSSFSVYPPSLPNPSPLCPTSSHPESSYECSEEFLSVPDKDITLADYAEFEIEFLNTGKGLKVCYDHDPGMIGDIQTDCIVNTAFPVDLKLKDPVEGFTATIEIDHSGLAKRL